MAYLLGDWATDRPATVVAGQLGTADLYQACLIFHRRPIAAVVNRLVGMGLYCFLMYADVEWEYLAVWVTIKLFRIIHPHKTIFSNMRIS